MNASSHNPVEPTATPNTPTPTPPAALAEREAPPPTTTRAPSPTLALIANLQGTDIAVVEAAAVSVGNAMRRGDQSAIVERLADQATLLEELGCKLLSVAGRATLPPVIQIYTSLALRALEQSRKTLATLIDMRGGPKSQVNLQVNVDGRGTNEILGGA